MVCWIMFSKESVSSFIKPLYKICVSKRHILQNLRSFSLYLCIFDTCFKVFLQKKKKKKKKIQIQFFRRAVEKNKNLFICHFLCFQNLENLYRNLFTYKIIFRYSQRIS